MRDADDLTDAREDSEGEPAEPADVGRTEVESGPLVRACAGANASPTSSEGEIYRAGAT